MTIDQMNDLEAIRQLKARYFRLMDTQQWEAWADCFAADVSAFYEGVPRANPELPVDVRCEDRAELVKGQGRRGVEDEEDSPDPPAYHGKIALSRAARSELFV
jgi:SnoaL-like domain